MKDRTKIRRWFPRFSLGHLFMLFSGIILGMVSLRPWELGVSPKSLVLVEAEVLHIDEDQVESLGIGSAAQHSSRRPEASAAKDQIRSLVQDGLAELDFAPKVMTINGQTAILGLRAEIPPLAEKGTETTDQIWRIGQLKVRLSPTILRTGRICINLSSEITEARPMGDNEAPKIPYTNDADGVEVNDGRTGSQRRSRPSDDCGNRSPSSA